MVYKRKVKTREEKRQEAEEDLQYIEQVDKLSDDQGRKFVHDTRKDEKDKQQYKEDSQKTFLQGKGIFTYLRSLSEFGQEKLDNLELGAGWKADCIPTHNGHISIYGKGFDTQEGILVVVRAPSGKVFIRGVHITTYPEIDMQAMKTLIEQAENTADNEKGLLLTGSRGKKTPGGIYIP